EFLPRRPTPAGATQCRRNGRPSRALDLQQPVGRDLATHTAYLGVLARQRAERRELDAEAHDVDEAGEPAVPRRRHLAGDKPAETGTLLEIDTDPPFAAHVLEFLGEAFLRIVIVERIVALPDDVVGGTADACMHHVERAALENAVAELELLDARDV